MVIIRVNAHIPGDDLEPIVREIRAQAETGIIVLPPWCELLSEVPQDEEIQILQQKADDRVAALERELAQAMAYVVKAHSCTSCKHEPIDPYICYKSGYNCRSCEEGGCACRSCCDGSHWEWRHSHGADLSSRGGNSATPD